MPQISRIDSSTVTVHLWSGQPLKERPCPTIIQIIQIAEIEKSFIKK